MLYPGQSVDEQGHMTVGDVDLVTLARDYGTPLYVMDIDEIQRRMSGYLNAFRALYPKSEIAYAGKAFCAQAFAPPSRPQACTSTCPPAASC